VQLVDFLGILSNLNQPVGFFPATLAVSWFAGYKFICLVFSDTILFNNEVSGLTSRSKNRRTGDLMSGASWIA